mgnify:CR=1 FL=1|jgi:DNA-binding MarR family transcriptional regulator
MAGRKRQLSDLRILQAVLLAPDPIVTAPELTERLEMSRQGLNPRLSELTKRGLLNRRKVGSRAVVYWITDDGRRHLHQNGPP